MSRLESGSPMQRSSTRGIHATAGLGLVILAALASQNAAALSVTDIRPASASNLEGQDASAIAISNDPINSARAVGGDVGISTTPGLRGGDGTAVADTTTSGPGQATADGRGGSARFGTSGIGGDGSATARVTSTAPALVQASAVAFGGAGSFDFVGGPAGPGGNAIVDVAGRSSGNGGAIELGVLRIPDGPFTQQPGAFGGNAQDTALAGVGGNAQSRSVAIAEGDGRIVVLDRARGGQATLGTGGNATSYAEGQNAGRSSIQVEANATSGFGGTARGVVSARARGVSTGGGDVFVTAIQQESLDTATSGLPRSAMRDAVSGGTSGHLYLEQRTLGATTRNAGGDATAALSATNELGGDLDAKVVATAGNVDYPGPGDAGDATIERLDFTGSTDRAVRLSGEATGGSLDQLVGHAGDASITSRILGSLASTLALDLRSTGGNGFNAQGYGAGGTGGNARIDSAVQTRSQTLGMVLSAKAGGGSTAPSTGVAGRGGDATLHVVASNDAGSASVVGQATGGVNSGDASIDIDVSTRGDGSNISIGLAPSFPPAASGARAGSISTTNASPAPGIPAARAGSATSRSVGIAEGNGSVTIYDLAQGGSGSGTAAAGGSASSTARGTSGGGKVVVQAEALAGTSGSGVDGASATLGEVLGQSTTGDVQVTGRAVAGNGRVGADAILIDRVGGQTAGNLSLEQNAFAGNSSTIGSGTRRGGAATSVLHHDGTSTSATFKAGAFGGLGTEGGAADTEIVARNLGGRVTASIGSFGGNASAGAGGAARGRIELDAAGTVEVGNANYGADPFDGPYGVRGGNGGFDSQVALRGGGAADSASIARTTTGAVRVFDAARGGNGSARFFGGSPSPSLAAGSGGSARSFASGASLGVGDAVLARSIAQGGAGEQLSFDSGPSLFGNGGSAIAESQATSRGLARSESRALAGVFGTSEATAQSIADGATSEAFATSQSQNSTLRRVAVTAGGQRDGASVIARSQTFAAGGTAPAWPSTDPATTPVAHSSAESRLAGSDVLDGANDPATPRTPRPLVTFDLDVGGAAGRYSSHIEIELPRVSQLALSNLQIQLISANGEGLIDAFHLSAHQGSVSFLDQGQTALDAVTGQFDGRILDLTGFVQTSSFSSTFVPIIIDLDWLTVDPSFRFSGSLAVTTIVPEPGSALLIGLGLVAMAARRTRSWT